METNFNQNEEGFLITDPRPSQYIQALQRKTVKELLMMRRQKWNCSQDDKNLVHAFKFARYEACGVELHPQPLGPPAPVNSHIMNHLFAASAENGHISPQQLQHPALQGHVAPAAEVEMTLFHWQIQRELQRVGGVSPEMLNMQDADGDTYISSHSSGTRETGSCLCACDKNVSMWLSGCERTQRADSSSDRSRHQSAAHSPRPADTRSPDQHSGPLGPFSFALVCSERPLPQPPEHLEDPHGEWAANRHRNVQL